MTKTILIVDDNASVRLLVDEYLSEQGYHIILAGNGHTALYAARHSKPDLILLDIMMPEMGGYDFLRIYRQESETPVIMLTAKLEELDKVLGLELGADDYITKPFGMRELVARIRAVLRRTEKAPATPDILRVGELLLDSSSHNVQVGGRSVHLTPSEFDLLAVFMASPGKVFSRLSLLELLGGGSFEGALRTIDVHIRNLRTKIEPDSSNPIFIETIFGIGYRLCSK
ncbi:MAG: response regulator transcription factor [Chloroflexi bacterium]|nr:response regulator transcription factor [Chloroflexota bacterium]